MELVLSIVAVAVALIGWYIAHLFYKQKPERSAELAATLPAGYKLLTGKYYVDEFYGATIVRPLLAGSTYFLGWVVDKAILGGAAWLIGGIATFCGALLQRWQSGNIRSYAAWLAAGAAAVLLFIFIPTLLSIYGINFTWAGH
jgi:NADH-quinone oxidoreductase subunit L